VLGHRVNVTQESERPVLAGQRHLLSSRSPHSRRSGVYLCTVSDTRKLDPASDVCTLRTHDTEVRARRGAATRRPDPRRNVHDGRRSTGSRLTQHLRSSRGSSGCEAHRRRRPVAGDVLAVRETTGRERSCDRGLTHLTRYKSQVARFALTGQQVSGIPTLPTPADLWFPPPMRFYFGEPTDTLTLEDQFRWMETFDGVTFACGDTSCRSENTAEVDELVPAGTMHRVKCENGHVTVGLPPARFTRVAHA
jgi:hypothetical protein